MSKGIQTSLKMHSNSGKTSIAKLTKSHDLWHWVKKGFQNSPDGGKITVIQKGLKEHRNNKLYDSVQWNKP